MEQRRVDIRNTRYGDLKGWAHQFPEGWKVTVSAQEYPTLPIHQAPGDGPIAETVEEAVEQFRRALSGA